MNNVIFMVPCVKHIVDFPYNDFPRTLARNNVDFNLQMIQYSGQRWIKHVGSYWNAYIRRIESIHTIWEHDIQLTWIYFLIGYKGMSLLKLIRAN